VAARRAQTLLEAGACVTVVAPELASELRALACDRLELVSRTYESTDVLHMRLVVAATNNREVDRRVAADARAAGALIVVAGDSALGDCHFMAMVRRGPLEIGIHSHGLAPAVTAAVRRRLDETLPVTLEPGLALVAELRTVLQARVHDPAERQRRWREAVEAGAMERLLKGDTDGALDLLRYTLLRE
jgi:precorrin-2 dehydrogenase/sirohydrochlorin ferrochelatase